MGKVVAIYICPDEGQLMQLVGSVRAIKGVGLEGDRYAGARGAFSKSGRAVIRHVSLIEYEAVQEANARVAVPFLLSDTRRNIVTSGVDLNALVGRLFMVSGVLMRGWSCVRPADGRRSSQERRSSVRRSTTAAACAPRFSRTAQSRRADSSLSREGDAEAFSR